MSDGGQERASAATATTTETVLLDTILDRGMRVRDEEQRAHATGMIAEFVTKITEGYLAPSKDVVSALDKAVAQIDRLLSDQLNAIMHHADFQRLEGTWRGMF